jgi:hypothetical protein
VKIGVFEMLMKKESEIFKEEIEVFILGDYVL